jgi:hypothetical protein
MNSVLSNLTFMLHQYDGEYYMKNGKHVSFYLIGHSLGGEIAFQFEGGVYGGEKIPTRETIAAFPSGEVASIITIDSPLNQWPGPGGSFNNFNIEDQSTITAITHLNELTASVAWAIYGTRTVTITNSDDLIVQTSMALIPAPYAAYSNSWAVDSAGQPSSIAATTNRSSVLFGLPQHGSLLHPDAPDDSTNPFTDQVFILARILAGDIAGEPQDILGPAT